MPTLTAVKVDGAKLRRLREDQLMSRAELAEKAGIHAEHLIRIENGTTRTPRMATIRKLVEALGVSHSEFTIRDD